MFDKQGTAKAIKRELDEDSTEVQHVVKDRRQAIAKGVKKNFSRYRLPECLEGASGNLRWRDDGAYFENAKGVASIALVATRMLRDLLYSREQMTERDIQEVEHFLNYVGGEEHIRRYTEGLRVIGQNNNATSDTRFRDIFKEDHTFSP
jgi:hypothetical protein